MKDLGNLDGDPDSTSAALAINDRGQIVGDSYAQALHTTHAVYYSPGGVIDLGTLGGLSSANAINSAGQVVGESGTASGNHAFITDLASMQMQDLNDLIPPGTGWKLFEATDINDAGQIVGSGNINGQTHAYLLTLEEGPPVAPGTSALARPEAPTA